MYVLLFNIIITKIVSGRWLKCEKNRRKLGKTLSSRHSKEISISSNLGLKRKNCHQIQILTYSLGVSGWFVVVAMLVFVMMIHKYEGS
jgi:hypothetical protein